MLLYGKEGDSEEERQLRGKAAGALQRYHERFQAEEAEPIWFERAFTFKLVPHLLPGRVDRVAAKGASFQDARSFKTRSEAMR